MDALKPTPYPLTEETIKAVATHLSTRAYTDADWQAGKIAVFDEASVQKVAFKAWRAYRSDSDSGSQRYRITNVDAKGHANFRDASWATVGVSISESTIFSRLTYIWHISVYAICGQR